MNYREPLSYWGTHRPCHYNKGDDLLNLKDQYKKDSDLLSELDSYGLDAETTDLFKNKLIEQLNEIKRKMHKLIDEM